MDIELLKRACLYSVSSHCCLYLYYEQPHRSYHDTNHIYDCLEKYFDVFANDLTITDEDKLVDVFIILFHDIVYLPFSDRNEEDSAEFFMNYFNFLFDHSELVKQFAYLKTAQFKNFVYDGILATKYSKTFKDPNRHQSRYNRVTDVDLSSLGESWNKYFTNGISVFHEYFPICNNNNDVYIEGRLKFIESVLQLPQIYSTDFFVDQYEARARENLANEKTWLETGKILGEL